MTNSNTLTIRQLIDRLHEIAQSRGLGYDIDTKVDSDIMTDGVVLTLGTTSLDSLNEEIDDLEDEVSSLKSKLDDAEDEIVELERAARR